MNLSMLLVTLSVATLTLAKPTETGAPSELAVVDGVRSSPNIIHMGSVSSTVNITAWRIRLDPRSRIEGFVINNLSGGRITGITSGVGDWDLSLGLEMIPEQTLFFQHRFYGTFNYNQLLSEVMEPREQVITETEPKLAVVDGVTSSSYVISSGNFQSSVNTIAWRIRLDPRSRIDGFVIDNLRGGRITGITSGIGDWDLELNIEKFPEETLFFQYRFYGTWAPNFNQLLSKVMEPRVEVTNVE